MKALVLIFSLIVFLPAQGIEAGIIFAEDKISMFRGGVSLKVLETERAQFSIVASYATGSKGTVELSAMEFGMRANFESTKGFYAKVASFLSIVKSSSEYFGYYDYGSPDRSSTEGKRFTAEFGIGYKIIDNLAIEGSYSILGLDGIRAGLVLNL